MTAGIVAIARIVGISWIVGMAEMAATRSFRQLLMGGLIIAMLCLSVSINASANASTNASVSDKVNAGISDRMVANAKDNLLVLNNARGQDGGETRPLQVVASFPIAADFVTQIGGAAVEVHTMVEAGESMHHFEPRASDLHALGEADLFVLNGAGFEPWWTKLVASAHYDGPVLLLSEGLALRPLNGEQPAVQQGEGIQQDVLPGTQQDEGAPQDELPSAQQDALHEGRAQAVDPHAWLRVDYARHYVKQLYQQLKALLPEADHAELRKRYLDYDARLSALHQELLQSFAVEAGLCAAVVVPHDSLFYFEQAYGCPQFIALEGASADAELSAYAFAQLVRQVQAQGVRAALPEYGLDERLVAQIARETGLQPGAPLYTETFAPDGNPVGNYLELMRWNQQVLQEALAR